MDALAPRLHSADLVVETHGLHKRYRDTDALSGVDLRIPRGALFGLVGPNGAGKSTLLGILAGLRHPTSGRVDLHVDPHRISVLPDTPQFEPWLTAFEVVDLARHLTDPSVPFTRVRDVLTEAGLGDSMDRRVGGFSRGMIQRLGLATSVIAEPELLLLDEPSAALDPVGRREVLDLVARMRAEATVLFSSHILNDVQEVCDHVGVLHHGRLAFQGPLDELLKARSGSTYVIEVRGSANHLAQLLEREPWVERVDVAGVEVRLVTSSGHDAERQLPRVLALSDVPVVAVVPETATLERIFLELTA